MKLELASLFLLILSIFLTFFLVKLKNEEPLQETEDLVWIEGEINALNTSKYVNISIEIDTEIYEGIISTERFSFEDALAFCEENNRKMPADHFKIHVNPGYGTIDDLFV